jgi:uracil phosphoribosyltransferase
LREIQETDYGDLADLERISLGLNRESLDERAFIVPGLGDAGDRAYGTR